MSEKANPLAELDVDISQESEMNKRIAADIAAGNQIISYGSANDNQVPDILWSQYGHIPTGRIAVEARRDSIKLLGSVNSPLLQPPMADRIYGIDVLDEWAALRLGDQLWERYQDVLKRTETL